MILDREGLVREARGAPSVHNAQPARWRFHDDGVDILADISRILAVSDPFARDVAIGCGCAVETTVEALLRRGATGISVDDVWVEDLDVGGHRLAARIRWASMDGPHADAATWTRRTWRGGFDPVPYDVLVDVVRSIEGDGVDVLVGEGVLRHVGRIGDEASRRVMASKPFRRELVDWMRLRDDDPRARRDGMDRHVLGMTEIEARIAPALLRSSAWAALDLVGATRPLVSEAKITRSASLIIVVSDEASDPSLAAGRRLVTAWNAAAARGLVGWPMSSIVDDDMGALELSQIVGLDEARRPRCVLRLGALPPGAVVPPQARLPVEELILHL